MSKARHRKSGGKASVVSGNPNVVREAKDDNDGITRKKGGKVKKKAEMDGKKSKHRFDRPGRKRGGAVGANRSPLSTAHGTVSAEKTPAPTDTYGGTPK